MPKKSIPQTLPEVVYSVSGLKNSVRVLKEKVKDLESYVEMLEGAINMHEESHPDVERVADIVLEGLMETPPLVATTNEENMLAEDLGRFEQIEARLSQLEEEVSRMAAQLEDIVDGENSESPYFPDSD